MDFSQCTVLCLGDVMIDRFMYGEVDRISPEAPVPVLRLTRTTEMLGGTGNVANNIAALGGQAILIGLVGTDSSARAIHAILQKTQRIFPALIETAHRSTVCKTRFIASHQQLIRTDEETTLPLLPDEEQDLIRLAELHVNRAQAVVLSDYGKGVLSPAVIAKIMALASSKNIPVFVDPKSDDFSRYRGVTCITPNLKELSRAAKMPVVDDESILAAGRKVMSDAGSAAILVTRSEKGMTLVEANGHALTVPARAREVFDVSGAGDTVIAAMALAHASGLTLSQSVYIANAAAGIVVSKFGTATADIEEVLHELADQEGQNTPPPPAVLTLDQIARQVKRWKEQGLKVGFTNGCFDIIHSGHVALLAAARAQCDRLIVALNTDPSVQKLKGPARPINTLERRAQVIAAIRYVDCVTAFDEQTPIALIERILPDVLIKGADYTPDTVVGADVVAAAGGRVYLAPLIAGQSTTNVVEKIKETTKTSMSSPL